MTALALFDAPQRVRAPERLAPGTCPLCGARMRASAAPWESPPNQGCRLGLCSADPAPGTPEAALVALNREILRGELVEVEFSIAALRCAIGLAQDRGRPHGAYLEQMFPLTMHRRILRGYVG